MSSFDLTGKRAAITGVSRGIGKAIAEGLAEAGADVVGVSTSVDAQHAVAESVRGYGREYHSLQADLADADAAVELGEQLAEMQIDILVNNAGVIRRAPAVEHGDDLWSEVIQVDLTSQFLLTRRAGAAMVSRGRGKIIFTASLLSFQGGINVPGYAAAKSGIVGLTRALANEWAPRGVNVNAIAPGYIATDNTQALRDDPERSRSILERIPSARWGRPADISGAAVFLASSAADYVSGIVLPVDGGWLAR